MYPIGNQTITTFESRALVATLWRADNGKFTVTLTTTEVASTSDNIPSNVFAKACILPDVAACVLVPRWAAHFELDQDKHSSDSKDE